MWSLEGAGSGRFTDGSLPHAGDTLLHLAARLDGHDVEAAAIASALSPLDDEEHIKDARGELESVKKARVEFARAWLAVAGGAAAAARAANDRGATPLHVACERGAEELAQLLLPEARGGDGDGADGDDVADAALVELNSALCAARDADGRTPLLAACAGGARRLRAPADDNGRAVMVDEACQPACRALGLVKLLLGRGARADARDAAGLTALHLVARWCVPIGLDAGMEEHGAPPSAAVQCVSALLAAGAKIGVVAPDGVGTALEVAQRQPRAETNTTLTDLLGASDHGKEQVRGALEQFAHDHGLGPHTIKDAARRFKHVDKDHSGTVDFDEFCDLLGVEPSMQVDDLFALFDEDASGDIAFPEFMIALSNFTGGDMSEKVKFAFMMFDEDGNGVITKDELTRILQAQHCSKGEDVAAMADVIMKAADKDGDHSCSFDEFVLVSKKFPGILFPE